jgi:hypothetical protein
MAALKQAETDTLREIAKEARQRDKRRAALVRLFPAVASAESDG